MTGSAGEVQGEHKKIPAISSKGSEARRDEGGEEDPAQGARSSFGLFKYRSKGKTRGDGVVI